MIKRIISLLCLWEQTMTKEQKMLELSVKAFELSIENYKNSKELEILRLKLRKKIY